MKGEQIIRWVPGDPPVARLSGDIDLANASQVFAAVVAGADGTAALIVDLTDVSFIDSRGLAELLETSRRAAVHVVAPAGSQPRRVLDITALSDALPTFDTVTDAVASLS